MKKRSSEVALQALAEAIAKPLPVPPLESLPDLPENVLKIFVKRIQLLIAAGMLKGLTPRQFEGLMLAIFPDAYCGPLPTMLPPMTMEELKKLLAKNNISRLPRPPVESNPLVLPKRKRVPQLPTKLPKGRYTTLNGEEIELDDDT